MGEAINIVKKVVNTNINEPLNKLIENSGLEIKDKINGSSGCLINPTFAYSDVPTLSSIITMPFITDNQEEVSVESVSGNDNKQYYNELWFYNKVDSVYYLNMIDLTTGVNTIKVALQGTAVRIFLVTKSYVYGYETISSVNYLFRYNKLTGVYTRSVNAIDSFFVSNISSLKFITYKDRIYAYFLTTSTTDTKKGYYQITDILDSGGAFSYIKLNDTIPELYFYGGSATEYVYNSYNYSSIIELDNDYVLMLGCEYYTFASVLLLKVNTLNGEVTLIDRLGSCKMVGLCPIEHNGKVVGALFGETYYSIKLININGIDVSVIREDFITKDRGSIISPFYYKDGKLHYIKSTGSFVKDGNLMTYNLNYVCYVPKGTKYYNTEVDKILKVVPKLRDSLSFDDNGMNYVGCVESNENHMFEFTEGGFYFIPGSYYNCGSDSSYSKTFYLRGTFA